MAVHIDADGRQRGTSYKLQLSTQIKCCEPEVHTACTYMNGNHVTSRECHSQVVLVTLAHPTRLPVSGQCCLISRQHVATLLLPAAETERGVKFQLLLAVTVLTCRGGDLAIRLVSSQRFVPKELLLSPEHDQYAD